MFDDRQYLEAPCPFYDEASEAILAKKEELEREMEEIKREAAKASELLLQSPYIRGAAWINRVLESYDNALEDRRQEIEELENALLDWNDQSA